MPSVACSTVIDVWPASSSTIMLSWVGSRCWTRMKAMPLSAGSARRSFRQASSPPAEAPNPDDRKVPEPRRGPRPGEGRWPDRGRAALA